MEPSKSNRVIGLFFLAIMGYYLLVCIFCAHQPLVNDEGRYCQYAENLTKGFYAPLDTKNLWNGPGYPLFISIFILFEIPIVAAKYCNAFFLIGAVLFLYRSLCLYTSIRKAFWCTVLFALYPPLLPELPRLLTESLSVFLVSGFVYFVLRSFRDKDALFAAAACLFGAYLMLTKVFYAYVITSGILLFLLLSLFRIDFLRAAIICSGCLVCCLPYLVYTYSLTGKLFYWANSGGTALHCMTNPNVQEYGDWFTDQEIFEDERLIHHRDFAATLQNKDYVERDALYKQKAIDNIKQYPLSYLSNWICNWGRIWFDYPFAYKYQRPHTLFYMFPNAILLSAVIVSLYPLLRSIRRLPSEIVVLGCIAVIFIFGSSLIYCFSRYLLTIVPMLLLLVSYCWTVVVKLKFNESLVSPAP